MKKIFCARKAPGTAADHADLIENPKFEPPYLGVSAGSAIFFAKNQFCHQHSGRDKRLHASRGCFGDASGACGQPPSRTPGLHEARLVRIADSLARYSNVASGFAKREKALRVRHTPPLRRRSYRTFDP